MFNKNLTTAPTNQTGDQKSHAFYLLGLRKLPIFVGPLMAKPQRSYKVLALRLYSVRAGGFSGLTKQVPYAPRTPTLQLALGTFFNTGPVDETDMAVKPLIVIVRFYGRAYRQNFDSTAFVDKKVFFWVDDKPRIAGRSLERVDHPEFYKVLKEKGADDHLLDDTYVAVALSTQSDFETLVAAVESCHEYATVPATLLFNGDEVQLPTPGIPAENVK